jgi:hypothetical protein
MGDVSQGQGWWLASDGRWYPPETHPLAKLAGAPATVAPVAPSVAPVTRAGGSAGPVVGAGQSAPKGGPPGSDWGRGDYWSGQGTAISGVRLSGGPSSRGLRRSVDPRGAFVAVLCLLLLMACYLPYYRVAVPGSTTDVGSHTFTVMAGTFGAWRVAIPSIAALSVIFGIVNSILRAGSRGAVGTFVVMRLLVLADIGLWALAAVYHHDQGPLASLPTSVTWVSWAAVVVAVMALLGSLASMGKSAD